tara:strand:+ start:371 stop:625 length:255 start_codon:yes stop_codon:yes gene_type:complete
MESYGWSKVNTTHRSISIGYESNCNEDGLVIDRDLKNKIEKVLEKYKVANYEIIEKSNKWVHSYEVTVTDNEYEKLKEIMLTKQ